MKGILFERPEAIQSASHRLKAHAHAANIEAIAGDFFESVPSGADARVMKHIIHDWDDEHCIRVLSNCRRATAPGGHIPVIDFLLSDGPESTITKLIDLEMLVMSIGGRERNQQELSALFTRAGLNLTRLLPTNIPVSILEASANCPPHASQPPASPSSARRPLPATTRTSTSASRTPQKTHAEGEGRARSSPRPGGSVAAPTRALRIDLILTCRSGWFLRNRSYGRAHLKPDGS